MVIVLAALALAPVVPLPRAHAHNDYAQPRPLLDALSHGFSSIEVDLFLVNGKLLVGHDRKDLTASRDLDGMYLKPLSRLIAEHGGHVYPKPAEVLLLVDIKADGAAVYTQLKLLLKPYEKFLTRFRNGKFEQGALTVVLSGDRPISVLAQERERVAFIDGRPENLLPAPGGSLLTPLISTSWAATFKWRGEGPMPAEERLRLDEMVRLAHRRRQKLRFWATPEDSRVWSVLLDAGVDLIGTDKQALLAQFLRSKAALAKQPHDPSQRSKPVARPAPQFP